MQYPNVNLQVLTPSPQPVDPDMLRRLVRLDETADPDDLNALEDLRVQALNIAQPKAAYTVVPIDAHGTDVTELAGVRFTSALLAENLRACDVCVPYVATCGTELDEWADCLTDPLAQYWADTLMAQYLRQAHAALNDAMREVFGGAKYASMNPGSLPQWPITEQKPLFTLLGGVPYSSGIRLPEGIGVRLTDACLMLPAKSGSGIFFLNETGYVNCRLCPKERCPNRRAPYEKQNT
ncbi:MAG: vitamin B12 dependent methionine synthase [Eubacteriales bacterium]|jgi:hypothetical protein